MDALRLLSNVVVAAAAFFNDALLRSSRDDLLLPPIEEMPNGTIASMHMMTIRYTRRRHRNVGDSPTLLDVGDMATLFMVM